jgi:hypothetical protein
LQINFHKMFIDKKFASQQESPCLRRAFTENNFAETSYDFVRK